MLLPEASRQGGGPFTAHPAPLLGKQSWTLELEWVTFGTHGTREENAGVGMALPLGGGVGGQKPEVLMFSESPALRA